MKKLLYGCLFTLSALSASAQNGKTSPGIIEFFTSEGCATCPPAELTMGRLQKEYPGLIVLSYHVDYGDNADWKDPNSKSEWGARQAEYATKVFGGKKLFTPQAIVNGIGSTVGNNQKGLEAMIEMRTAPAPDKPSITLNATPKGDNVIVDYEAILKPGQTLLVSLVRKKVISDVKGGANRGKNYSSGNVVLEQRAVRGIKGIIQFALPADRVQGDYSLVALIQDVGSMQISSGMETVL